MIHQKLPTNWQKREKLRDKGQFWTPEWVTKAMVSYIAKDTNLVFDPAAGKGAFFNALLQINPSINYYGIDIDEYVLADEIYQKNNRIGINLWKRCGIFMKCHNTFKTIIFSNPLPKFLSKNSFTSIGRHDQS